MTGLRETFKSGSMFHLDHSSERTLEQQSGYYFLKSRKRTILFSPWVVTMEAMEQFIVPNMEMKNPILDYLTMNKDYNFDLNLAVSIKGENQSEYNQVGTSNFKVCLSHDCRIKSFSTCTGLLLNNWRITLRMAATPSPVIYMVQELFLDLNKANTDQC